MGTQSKAQSPRRGRSAPPQRFSLVARIRAHLFMAFLILLCGTFGALMIGNGTVTFITCQRDHRATLSCSAQTRILGMLPLRNQSINNIRTVEATVDPYRRTGFTNKGTDYHDVIVFHTADGSESVVRLGDGWKFGTPAADIERQINELLEHPSEQTLTLWHGSWKGLMMLVFGVPVFAVSLVLLGAVVYGYWRILRERIAASRSYSNEHKH